MTYSHRKDIRTDEQFAHDIKERTSEENYWMYKLFADIILPEFPDAKLIDTGIDNKGNIVYDAKNIGDPDFAISLNNKLKPIEVKVSPYACATLKLEQIKRYMKKDIWIFLVICSKSEPKYYLFPSKHLSKFLDHGIDFISPMFGNKPTKRLFRQDLKRLYSEKSFAIPRRQIEEINKREVAKTIS